jgi:hypothetical protein
MKKFTILLIILISFNSYSQIKDTTKVIFPTKTVRLIAKELIIKDGLLKENTLLYKRVSLFENKIQKQDTIIFKQNNIIKNDSLVKLTFNDQLSLKDKLNEGLKQDLKKEKRTSLFYKITTGVATALTIFIAIK